MEYVTKESLEMESVYAITVGKANIATSVSDIFVHHPFNHNNIKAWFDSLMWPGKNLHFVCSSVCEAGNSLVASLVHAALDLFIVACFRFLILRAQQLPTIGQ